jgi:ABC-type microcin C transport system permease subunit YejE
MPQTEPTPNPRIELDLAIEKIAQNASPHRNRPIVQEPRPSLPKIEPILGVDDVGSDETARTVGIFFLLSALPGVLSLLFGHGSTGLLGTAIPIYFGLGLLRGDEFVKQWVFAACFVQLIITPISALVFPTSMLFVIGGLAQSGGLLVLVSGRALSKQMYRALLAAVAIGTLMSAVGFFLH